MDVESNDLPTRRVHWRGDLVGNASGQIAQILDEAAENGLCELVLDIAGVEMVDSRGLSQLIGLGLALQREGGRLTIANPKPEIAALLAEMRLDSQFEVQEP
ncbi:STAS domain-containing protein [Oceanidesulfovibrio marinus]|uniref:STAS domain-containing protein n=1 Tax=Oceanidesulfovibrio marinus TaxID=370038 RepID=A0ABX6NEP6_9BACT|nr:STAS domain-containing protein [Oceanidesulfovibrio marinus]